MQRLNQKRKRYAITEKLPYCTLVVVAPRQNLLPRGSKNERMLVLSRETAGGIAERRVLCNKTRVDETLEAQQVAFLANVLKVTRAESQSTKVLVDGAEQLLGTRKAQWDVRRSIVVPHIVRALHVLVNVALARAAKGLNGIKLVLLHLGVVIVAHNGDGFSAVDLVLVDRMAIQITDRLDCTKQTLESPCR